MGIEPITSVLQTDASPSRPQTLVASMLTRKRLVNRIDAGKVAGAAAILAHQLAAIVD